MCGIFLYISQHTLRGKHKKCLCKIANKIKHRGPDQTQIRYYSDNVMMAFHRLAIVDPTPTGIQPFESQDGRFVCMTNGEIYNYKKLKKYLEDDDDVVIEWKTHSDCEVIVHLFDHLVNSSPNAEELTGAEEALRTMCSDFLDGEYALVIYDHESERVYYATDELSTRPLFIGTTTLFGAPGYMFASEQKSLVDHCHEIGRVETGTYGWVCFNALHGHKYSDLKAIKIMSTPFDQAVLKLRELLIENTVKKLNPDREFAFLLSGGVDSSLICAIAARELAPVRIRTFTVGFSPDATDILAARRVAKHIDSIHTEFICSYGEGVEMIPFAIYHNESWDQTTTRASIPMLLCVKKIREKYPSVAVIFSGEVADELLRGYLYNRKTPSLEEGRKDQIMRLGNIHTSDGLRADRVTAAYSFECRFPFFSKDLLKYVMSLPREYLNPPDNQGIEKFILRKAFDKETGDGYEYLPHDILWRTKNAFSDATSVKSGWKEHLKSFCNSQVSDSRFEIRKTLYYYCTPQTKEDMYYRELFDEYGFEESTIPFKWMSSWCNPNATDSSATTIDVFEEDEIH